MASRCLFRHPSISKQFQIICKGWSRNACFDVNCPHAHPTKLADALAGVVSIKEDVGIDHKSSTTFGISKTTVLCPFFQTGYCKFGSDCKNSHNLTTVSSYSTSSSPRASLDKGSSLISSNGNSSSNNNSGSASSSSGTGISTGNSTDNNPPLSNTLGLSVLEKYSKSGLGMAHPSKRPNSDPAAPRASPSSYSSYSSSASTTTTSTTDTTSTTSTTTADTSSITTQAHSIASSAGFGSVESNDINAVRGQSQSRNADGNPEKRIRTESASRVEELGVGVDCRPRSDKNYVDDKDRSVDDDNNNNISSSDSGNNGLTNSSRSNDSTDVLVHMPDAVRNTSADITFDIEIDGSFI